MSRTFKKVDYDRALDLTVRLGACLPPDHLARFVVDSVAQLDLSALYAQYFRRHRVVDLLADRTAETFARWLQAHPDVKWISRDRSGEYARGAHLGAPEARAS